MTRLNFARLWIAALCFQLTFAPTHGFILNSAVANTPGNSEENQNVAAIISHTTAEPEIRDHMARMTEIANAVETGQSIELTPEERNTFRRLNQTVEITRPVADGRVNPATGEPVVEIIRTLDLNQLDVERPNIVFSNIRYRIENGDLVIEATQGENEHGRGGVVVARQRIPGLNLVSLTADEDLLVLVNNKGELSALTMLELKPQLFTPLNVFEKVAARRKAVDLSNAKVTVKFVTPGVTPYDPAEVDADTILPLDENGKPVIHAGDVMVRSEVDGKTYLLGIFKRQNILESALAGYHFLIREKALVRPDSETIDTAREVFDGEMGKLDQIEADISQGRQTALEAAALKAVTGAHLSTYVESIQGLKNYQAKDYHGMTLDEWKDLNAQIEKRAKVDVAGNMNLDPQMRQERDWQRYISQERLNGKSQSEIESEQKVSVSSTDDASAAKESRQLKGRIGKLVDILKTQYRENKTIIAMLAASTAYISLPFIHDIEFVRQHLMAYNAIYTHLFPSVLLDTVYRVYMVKGMALLMTFPVITMMASFAVGKALKYGARIAGESTSKWAIAAREFNKKWGEDALTNWQRVTSFGMRLWAQVIYPVWCRIPQLMRQKSFVSAISAGENPFARVDANSDLGKSLKLTESMFVGINNPFLGRDELDRKADLQRQAQGLLLEQKQRAKVMAMAIASLAVAGRTDVDPATLMYTAQNGAHAGDVADILANGRTARSWYAVTDAIQGTFLEMVKHGVNLKEIDPKDLAEAWKNANAAADLLRSQTQGVVNARYLTAKFRRALSQVTPTILTYGTSEYQFLNNVFVNLKITENVKHQFLTDYFLSAVQIPLVGQRADLATPSALAHDVNGFLYSTPGHLSEQAYQTFLYQFIVPARMAQVYQKVTVNEDNTYTPSYQIEYSPDEKQETLNSGLSDAVYDVANFKKHGFGNIMIRDVTKRLKTIAGYFIVGMTMRSYFGEQAFNMAFAGWFLTEATAFFRYTWPWTIQNLAEMAGGDRVNENMAALKAAQTKIFSGLKENNRGKSQELLDEGYREMVELFRTRSPQAWNGLKAILTSASGNRIDLVNQTPPPLRTLEAQLQARGYATLVAEHQKFVQNGEHYYGLLAGLAQALQSNDEAGTKQYEEALRTILQQNAQESAQPELIDSIRQMNAVTLLKYAAQPGNSPIFTKQNTTVRNIAILFCAFYTTYLAVGLSVDTFNPAKLTAAYVGETATTFIAAYVGLAWATHRATWTFIVDTLKVAREEGVVAAGKSVKSKFEKFWYGENPEVSKSLEPTDVVPVPGTPHRYGTTGPALPTLFKRALGRAIVNCQDIHLPLAVTP